MTVFIIILVLLVIVVAAVLVMLRKRRVGRVLIAQPRSGRRSGKAGS